MSNILEDKIKYKIPYFDSIKFNIHKIIKTIIIKMYVLTNMIIVK